MAFSESSVINPSEVLAVVLGTYLMIILDISIVITGLPEIRSDLGFSSTGLSWVQNAYTLSFGSLLLLGARAGDLLGRRRMFIIGLTVFSISSLMIGLAQTAATMIIGRLIQGAGAAVLAPSTLALLSTHFPEGPERIKALAWYAATAGVGASLGLVLGGFFAGWLSWRVGFIINAPFALLLIFMALRSVAESERHAGNFDIPGALISTLSMGALVFGIVHSASDGWADMTTQISVFCGIVMLALFVLVEAKVAHPMMPLRLFSSRIRVGAYLARMLFLGAMVSFFFFSTQYMQQVLEFSPFEAGLAFLPFTLLTFVASVLVPRMTRRFGNERVAFIAMLLMMLGMAGLTLLDAQSGYWLSMALPMLLIGLGNGAALGPLTIAGVAGVENRDAGAASGVVNAAHQLGGTLGLSLLVVVFAYAHSDDLSGKAQFAQQITAGYLGASVMLLSGALIIFMLNMRSLPTVDGISGH